MEHISDPTDVLGVPILEALDLPGAWDRPVRVRTVVPRINGNKQPPWNQALNRLLPNKDLRLAFGLDCPSEKWTRMAGMP